MNPTPFFSVLFKFKSNLCFSFSPIFFLSVSFILFLSVSQSVSFLFISVFLLPSFSSSRLVLTSLSVLINGNYHSILPAANTLTQRQEFSSYSVILASVWMSGDFLCNTEMLKVPLVVYGDSFNKNRLQNMFLHAAHCLTGESPTVSVSV